MKKIILLFCAGLIMGLPVKAVQSEKPENPAIFGVWWRGGDNAAKLKKQCPWISGVFANVKWSALEPRNNEFDWKYFDNMMAGYAQAGFYIQFIVMAGPDAPQWIYSSGVPAVKCTEKLNPHGQPHSKKWKVYPFYLSPEYKKFYHRMITEVAKHIDTLRPEIREKIICIQTAEGTTGDEGGYKGSPIDRKYNLPDKKWDAFKFEAWKLFEKLYSGKQPKIHILINSGNFGQYDEWIRRNMPGTWRKAGNPGHGYQLNNEMDMIKLLDPLINHFDKNGNIIRCRSEMDETFKGWFKEAPVWNMYWLNLWGLHFGLDVFQHQTDSFEKREYDGGFIFYAKYGGQKDPAVSPGAFCALRDGLDANDFKRFPAEKFGKGSFGRKNKEEKEGIKRCLNIIDAFKQYGARQGDPEKAMQTIMENRDAKAMNDAGWNIWPGNYQRYLTQIDPDRTSRGYWRVGPKDQAFGRFARGFDASSGKNIMFFDLDDNFFKNKPGPYSAKIRVVYFDQGKGSWELKYDAVGKPEKTIISVTNKDTGVWKEITGNIQDASFANKCARKSDIMLVNTSGENTIFHMIEVMR